jgi:hypothetical protein
LTRGNDHFRLNSLGFTNFAFYYLRIWPCPASTALPDHVDLLNRKGGIQMQRLGICQNRNSGATFPRHVQWKQRVEMRKAIVSLSKKICSSLKLLSNSAEKKAAQDLHLIAFSWPEPVSTSLKNALGTELPKANALKRARIL